MSFGVEKKTAWTCGLLVAPKASKKEEAVTPKKKQADEHGLVEALHEAEQREAEHRRGAHDPQLPPAEHIATARAHAAADGWQRARRDRDR